MTVPTDRIEAAALALAARGLAPEDGASVEEQVAALWAIDEIRQNLLAQAKVALDAVHAFEYQAARARIGTEVTVAHMVASDDTLNTVARRHGTSADDEANVNGMLQHLISPIVGHMRMGAEDPWRIERLSLALALLQRQQNAREAQ